MPCAWPRTPLCSMPCPTGASRSAWARAGIRSPSPPSARASTSAARSSPTSSRPCAPWSRAVRFPPTICSTPRPGRRTPTDRDSTGACGRRRSPPAGPEPPAPPGTGSCSHAPSRVRRTTRARPSTRCSCRSSTPTSPNFPTTSPRASSPPARRWSPMPPTCPGCARSPNRRCGTRPTASSAMTPPP